jgi:hypothetical protein
MKKLDLAATNFEHQDFLLKENIEHDLVTLFTRKLFALEIHVHKP